jgi:hypothetical protein
VRKREDRKVIGKEKDMGGNGKRKRREWYFMGCKGIWE